MAVLPSPDCRDDNHNKCPNVGWDEVADDATGCPCHCHPGPRCGQPHEAPALAYLGQCIMGPDHDGPHHFDGPIDGTVISVTLGDGWERISAEDLVNGADVLEDLGRAIGRPKADQ